MTPAKSTEDKVVNEELAVDALAKAVYEGDIVNFRLFFMPFSPARKNSPERFETPKYQYLLPDEEMRERHEFRECRSLVAERETLGHIRKELDADRPPQLPSELLLELGDNAVRTGKYSSAAQAYELLRVRARMQTEFFNQADSALEQRDIRKAVRGYRIATALGYDYAAFPEPLPVIPDFQTRALLLHAEYPATPEDSIGMRDTKPLLDTALAYLLLSGEAASRLQDRPIEVLLDFLKELVRRRDPEWKVFVERYREACALMRAFAQRMVHAADETGHSGGASAAGLAEEIEKALGDDPRRITACLLGRTIENGEWWQYLKELAYEHPAAALWVARQAVGDLEILVPRHRADSPVALALGLEAGV